MLSYKERKEMRSIFQALIEDIVGALRDAEGKILALLDRPPEVK